MTSGHAGLLNPLDQRLLLGPDGGDRLHHQQHAVHVRDALAHDVDHIVAESGPRLVKARRVQQHELGVAVADDGGDAAARGLRLGRDDRDLLPHQGVRKRGLADVRPAAYGDHGCFCHFMLSCFIPRRP